MSEIIAFPDLLHLCHKGLGHPRHRAVLHDLTLFDPHLGWQVDADELASKAKNSPFDGRPVQGRVLRTIIDGRTVFEPDE